MKEVITNNGRFNITEELYESIVSNNPELLMEKRGGKKFRKQNVISKNKKKEEEAKVANYTSQLEHINNCENIDDREQLLNDLINDFNEETLSDDLKQEIEQQIKAANDNIETIKHNEKVKVYNKNMGSDDLNFEKDDDDNLSPDEKDRKKNEQLGNVVTNPQLRQIMEKMILSNRYILERCQRKVEDTLGLIATLPGFEYSTTAIPVGYMKEGNKIYYKLSNGNVVDNNGEPVTLDKNNFKDLGDNTLLDDPEEQKKLAAMLRKANGNNKDENNVFRGTTEKRKSQRNSIISALQGGMIITPNKNTDENVKLYTAAIEIQKGTGEAGTIMHNLMKERISPQIREISADRKNKEQGMTENNEAKYKFANMIDDFLSNIVSKVIVTREALFNSVVNTIRFDEYYKGKYIIDLVAVPTQFDIKRQVIKFQNRQTGTVDALLIVQPIVGAGIKALRGIFDIFNHDVQTTA